RFRGVNRHRGRVWTTVCTVTAADRPSRFEFLVRVAGLPSAKWRYHIEPTGDGCRVAESTRRLSPRPIATLVNFLGLGVRDRDAHNQRNIERTLTSLKTHAESLAANHPA
ncbi:MAG: SRPBCC family protein, partial [Micromonosporaceae bacterium]|nr:SRPBCC family protein [Micromonosporaceae bacterium]